MKSYMKYIKLIGLFVVAMVFSISCVKWDEETQPTMDSASSVTVNLTTVGDSSLTVTVSNSKAGYIAVHLFEGTGIAIPEDDDVKESVMTGNVGSMAYYSIQSAPGEVYTITFSEGIQQDASYEVLAFASNADGVISDGALLQATTSDAYAPVLMEVDPAPGDDAIFEQGASITLYFDEAVVVDPSKEFTLITLFSGIREAGTAVAMGNTVVITPVSDYPEGDYVFLSYPDGAVTDPTGNAADGISSGLDDEGYPMGIYTRMVRPLRAAVSVGPEADSIPVGSSIEIVFDDAVDADSKIKQGMISLTYYDAEDTPVTVEYVDPATLTFSEMTATVPQAYAGAGAGWYVELYVAEEAFDIGIYVPNAEVEGSWKLY